MSDEQACENHPFKLEWLEHAERPQESPSLPSISSLTLRQVGKALSSAAINQSGAAGCQQVLQTSLQQAAIDRWLQHGTRCTVASFRFWPLATVWLRPSLCMVRPRSVPPSPERHRPQSQDIERCSPASYGQAEVERPASSLSCDRSVMPLYVSLCECHTWLDQGQWLLPSL